MDRSYKLCEHYGQLRMPVFAIKIDVDLGSIFFEEGVLLLEHVLVIQRKRYTHLTIGLQNLHKLKKKNLYCSLTIKAVHNNIQAVKYPLHELAS